MKVNNRVAQGVRYFPIDFFSTRERKGAMRRLILDA